MHSGLGGDTPAPRSLTLPNVMSPPCPHSLFGDIQEEEVQDAESVRLQQQAHRQQHSCTLDECFQLYTKEEQVPHTCLSAVPGVALAVLGCFGGGCGTVLAWSTVCRAGDTG